jgi:hypothetical protein
MDDAPPYTLCDQITARIIAYHKMGALYVHYINLRLIGDIGKIHWHELYDPTGYYGFSQYPEEDVIRDVLTSVGRTNFVFPGSDLSYDVGHCWQSGCRDLAQIVQQTTQFRLSHNRQITGIDVAVVRRLLTRMGFIV